MRTIYLYLIFVLILVLSTKTIAQVIDSRNDLKTPNAKSDEIDKQNSINLHRTNPNMEKRQKSEKRQIYIGSDWSAGTIVLHNGGKIDSYYLRYNILIDQLEFIAGKDTLVYTNPQELNTVSFDGHIFIYESYLSENIIHKGYFELIVPGKNKLMLKRSVANYDPDSMSQNYTSQKRYRVERCYFISKPGLPASKLVCNRKSALKYLNDHKEDISEYLRITHNKVHTIEDLKLLVSYYNSLDEEY